MNEILEKRKSKFTTTKFNSSKKNLDLKIEFTRGVSNVKNNSISASERKIQKIGDIGTNLKPVSKVFSQRIIMRQKELYGTRFKFGLSKNSIDDKIPNSEEYTQTKTRESKFLQMDTQKSRNESNKPATLNKTLFTDRLSLSKQYSKPKKLEKPSEYEFKMNFKKRIENHLNNFPMMNTIQNNPTTPLFQIKIIDKSRITVHLENDPRSEKEKSRQKSEINNLDPTSLKFKSVLKKFSFKFKGQPGQKQTSSLQKCTNNLLVKPQIRAIPVSTRVIPTFGKPMFGLKGIGNLNQIKKENGYASNSLRKVHVEKPKIDFRKKEARDSLMARLMLKKS